MAANAAISGPDSVHNLAKNVYAVSATWPLAELHGLTAQVRRAAVSVPANNAEGVGRGNPREAARYARIALASLYELDTLLELAVQVGVSKSASVTGLRQGVTDLSRRISGFIRYQRQAATRPRD